MVSRPLYRYDLYKHGVTQSMLSLFLACRYQCYLKYVEGWAAQGESLALDYGTASHWCVQKIYERPDPNYWTGAALKTLVEKYNKLWKSERKIITASQMQQHELILGMLDIVIPMYVRRIQMLDRQYSDFKNKTWLQLEQTFKVTANVGVHEIPVLGKFDGIYHTQKNVLWVFDSKNLSRIDEEAISETLPVDLQVMLYVWAAYKLQEEKKLPKGKIGGAVLNVMRRPGLRRCNDESLTDFLGRIAKDVQDPKRMDHYFMRFECALTKDEVMAWEETQLIPILRDVAVWASHPEKSYINPNALITKYGRCSMYRPVLFKDFSGCVRKPVPFMELEE